MNALASNTLTAAQTDSRLMGVLPAWLGGLISLLLGNITTIFPCLTPTPPAVKSHLDAAYDDSDPQDPSYSQHVLGPMWHEARRQSRQDVKHGKEGAVFLTIEQAQAVAFHVLDTARTSDDETLQSAIAG